ncbi:MAG: hypothetical protein ABID61_06445, partial [Candidatus Micrarchaeota archaeon]
MKTESILLIVGAILIVAVVVFFIVNATQNTNANQNTTINSNGQLISLPFFGNPDEKIIYPSYFEMVKNRTSRSYYVYFILYNKPGFPVVTPVKANITMVDNDGNTFYFQSFDVKNEDYVTYISRISKKDIGKAFIV